MTPQTPQHEPDDHSTGPRALLARLCIDDPRLHERFWDPSASALDPHTTSLVRIAGLITADAPASSMRSAVDDAIAAGASAAEIVAAMTVLVDIVGLPRIVRAAPHIAAALGYDDDLIPPSDG